MKSRKRVLIAVGLMLGCGPAWSQTAAPAPPAPARGARVDEANWWSQAGGENGPTRLVWAAHKNPETPYKPPNKPIWHIADVLKAHKGQSHWEQKVLLTRDFDGRYVQIAPGDKSKCMFWADDRAWGWVKGLGVQYRAAPVLLLGDGRQRAGRVLHHHAGGPSAILSGE